LQLEGIRDGINTPLNMIVPIDLLPPILDDMMTLGRPNRPARPWLGVFASELEDRIVILGLAAGGPASRADLRAGDVILGIDGQPVDDLATFFRKIWGLGDAGVEVPLRIWRDGDTFDMRVNSGDRNRFLKAPKVH
jgi:S1-C subfamily serine protease